MHALFCLLCLLCRSQSSSPPIAPLPPGVIAAWDSASAFREKTSTRERICINGLWRWQPAGPETQIPIAGWGWFKAPGSWPGITDYMQKDCQSVIPHPAWKSTNLGTVTAAWYEREITVPTAWSGRRISLSADYVNSLAAVFLDGKPAGEIRFPGGALDITAYCKPGSRHTLSLRVTALPLKSVMTSYTDTNAAREVRGSVARRGLCGDLFLTGEPRAERLTNVKVDPSVRRGEIAFDVSFENLQPGRGYRLGVEILDHDKAVHRFTAPLAAKRVGRENHARITTKWRPNALWDIHTAHNMLTARVGLIGSSGRVLDAALPVRFGYRELWIDGRDFILNGTRIYLSALPLDNAQVGAAWSTYAMARESMLRLKSFGINFVYTHNYDCEPGSHLSFDEILRAADDVGMLVALSQPHFSAYDWQKPDADSTNGYRRHAEFYVKVAQNHPSVVAYAMSHNATSYDEAKNPDKMDGFPEPRDSWAQNNAKKALRAEAIVKGLDPSRIVYHHSSGSLGAMYTENFYVNFAPIQELSDWFATWAAKGVKPMFLCEYGVPFSWDWAMYRGWFKGKREWGSAEVPWELCIAEWNAQFVGDRAYRISDREKADLRWEAAQFRAGREGWHRWDYPTAVGSSDFQERNEVFAAYIKDNWRAYRTWGVSAFSPWEYEVFWSPSPGIDRKRRDLPVDWAHLQRPGFSPDFIDSQYETMNLAYQRSDWAPSYAAQALMRNNRPLLAYIGGKAARFTSKDHNFAPGDVVEKQFIIVNNSRETVTCDCRWAIRLDAAWNGSNRAQILTGDQARLPVRISLPKDLPSGRYTIDATFTFSNGEVQTDAFDVNVLAPRAQPQATAQIACFDPKGETTAMLNRLGIRTHSVTATSDLSGFDLLIIGKQAITLTNEVPDIRRVRSGLKTIVFEQSAEVLEQRLGFRVADYGLRNVFPRVMDHPVLAGLHGDYLHDWTGEATLSSPRLQYTLKPMYGPIVKWCGFDVPHVWRCGSQGNVASVLIEKPARGDFLPLLDGGYSLQYSPLIEFHEGSGMAVFCQLDVTGRTESDPVADQIAANLVRYVSTWKPYPVRHVVYVGEPAGLDHLTASGFAPKPFTPAADPRESILVLGPGAMDQVGKEQASNWRNGGGRALAVGLDQTALAALISPEVRVQAGEHIASLIESGNNETLLAGIGPSDVHNRDPGQFPLIAAGAEIAGNGILATKGSATICQLVPWRFDPAKRLNLKRTFRRSSVLISRLLCNLGAATTSPILDDMATPLGSGTERRWLHGLYLDTPDAWDDPYRFFGW